MSTPALRRAARRMRFRSRSTSVVIALSALVLGCAYIATEAVLAALGRPALLMTPADAASRLGSDRTLALAVAAGAAIVAILLVIVALTPGRRARRVADDDRLMIIVDDQVVASSVSRSAAEAARVASDQVQTSVARRRATVSVRPTSGFPVASEDVQAAVSEGLSSIAFTPALRPTVRLESQGVVR